MKNTILISLALLIAMNTFAAEEQEVATFSDSSKETAVGAVGLLVAGHGSVKTLKKYSLTKKELAKTLDLRSKVWGNSREAVSLNQTIEKLAVKKFRLPIKAGVFVASGLASLYFFIHGILSSDSQTADSEGQFTPHSELTTIALAEKGLIDSMTVIKEKVAGN